MDEALIRYDTATRLVGLLGCPLGHSIVPTLHNALYRFGGVNAVLLPMELKDVPGALDRFFDAVQTLRMAGLIVTMPYKTRVLPYMDEAAEECRVFNCVNAVRYAGGKFSGAAFDGYGLCQAIEDAGCRLDGREALLLGAGGVCGPVAAEMARRGVSGFTILNRTPEKAQRLAAILRDFTGRPARAGCLCPEELEAAAKRAGVVAQCTSAGMHGTNTVFPHLDFLRRLDPGTAVADVLYNPPQSAFLAAAAQAGLRTVNGMGMLSNQANRITRFFLDADLGEEGKKEAERVIQKLISQM